VLNCGPRLRATHAAARVLYHCRRRGGAAAWPLAAKAQQAGRIRRIGVVMSFGANDPEGLLRAAALEDGLRTPGWINGHNIRIEYRWAGNPEGT
jgi:hypothetical protein